MKSYKKPTIETIVLKPEEQIASAISSGTPKVKGNNGFGNGDQDAPGYSLYNNNAENAQSTRGNSHMN